MSSDQNKAVVRKFFEWLYNAQNPEEARTLVTSHFAKHQNSLAESLQGFEEVKKEDDLYRHAFPDKHTRIEMQISEGDKVMTLWTTTGTMTGDLPNLPASGKKMEVQGVAIHRIDGGRIAEEWEFWNERRLLG